MVALISSGAAVDGALLAVMPKVMPKVVVGEARTVVLPKASTCLEPGCQEKSQELFDFACDHRFG